MSLVKISNPLPLPKESNPIMSNSKSLPNSIFIESREWRDREAGNSYFSTRVKVDGKFLYSSGMELGYEEQHIHTALASLVARGVIPSELSTPYALRVAGVALYKVKYDSLKRELFKNEELEDNV